MKERMKGSSVGVSSRLRPHNRTPSCSGSWGAPGGPSPPPIPVICRSSLLSHLMLPSCGHCQPSLQKAPCVRSLLWDRVRKKLFCSRQLLPTSPQSLNSKLKEPKREEGKGGGGTGGFLVRGQQPCPLVSTLNEHLDE